MRVFSRPTFITPSFLWVCLGAWLLFSAYHVITPVFPLYLNENGMDGLQLGALVSSFMVASIIVRPFAGKWADEISRQRLMLIGLGIFGTTSLAYLLPPSLPLLLITRVIQGAGFALFNTSASSYVVKLIPPEYKAEAIGYYSNAIKLAMAIAPGTALYLAEIWKPQFVFLVSVGLVVLSAGAILKLDRFDKVKTLKKGRLFNRQAAFPGFIMGLNSAAFGALIPFFPLLAAEKGVAEVGWFYTVYAICLMASRFMTGPLSDRFGRTAVVVPGMIAVTLTLLLMMLPIPSWSLIALAGLYGFAAGTVQPSLMAMAAERADDSEQGSAMATFTLLTDSGIAWGSFLMGTLGSLVSYTAPLGFVAAGMVLGVVLLLREQVQTSAPSKLMVGL
jgi:MFS family permease